MTLDEKNHKIALWNVRSCKNIHPYQFLCFYDEYWLNNNQKNDLQHYANEFFGGNR